MFEYIRGDANGDLVVDIADVVYLINYLFIDGPAPEPLKAGDANCDEVVDIADVVYLINYLFIDGPPPCEG
ncbi:MAG: dockerin type I repeat-containing protein [candidate division Zixibacteria bacterium]|nr:dockerin type I repeat-containing protein [candidate division Zixibacteria bacterium]